MVTLKTTTNIVLRTHLKWTCCLSSLPILLCSYTRTSPFIKDVYKYSVTPSFAWDWPCRRHLSFAVDNSAKLPEVQLEDRSRNKSNLKPWIQHSFPFDESKRYETHEVSKIKFLTLQEHRPSTTKLEKEGTNEMLWRSNCAKRLEVRICWEQCGSSPAGTKWWLSKIHQNYTSGTNAQIPPSKKTGQVQHKKLRSCWIQPLPKKRSMSG